MRYYNIVLKTLSGQIAKRRDGTQLVWTTHPNGQLDRGAPDVTLDLTTTSYATPAGGCLVSISGISLLDIQEAQNYGPVNLKPNFTMEVYGGMKPGLPLATAQPPPAMLTAGQIQQCYANWQGIEMNLNFVILASGATQEAPLNFAGTWTAGQTLASCLKTVFSNAYPSMKQNIAISPNLVLAHDEYFAHPTLEQLASAVLRTTVGTIGTNYPGVTITLQQGQIYVFDGTVPPLVKTLNFTDLVGQPTWIGQAEIQIKTIMRGDILVGNIIKMPAGLVGTPGQALNSDDSFANYRNQSAFTGTYVVKQVRHIGYSRQADGSSWVTIFNAVPQGAITVPSPT